MIYKSHLNELKILRSEVDGSVNFIRSGDFPGYTESRFARRAPHYFIAYLSPQSGCEKACAFCHLTLTKQTKYIDSSVENILLQAKDVLAHYESLNDPAKIVHFSFMSRGEPLASRVFHEQGEELMERLSYEATKRSLFPRIMISTIMPEEMSGGSLAKMFPTINPNIYYSIYSLDPAFRKKWLPKALPVDEALNILKEYQDMTNKIVRLHWAFIKGENDSPESVQAIVEAVTTLRLRVDVNIVRYNPFSEKQGEEPSLDHIEKLTDILVAGFPQSKIKTVTRLDTKIYAACGMFYPKEK